MKLIRRVALLAGLFLVTALAQADVAPAKAKDLIIGTWETTVGKGPVQREDCDGTVAPNKGAVEFTKDGKLNITAGPITVDGTYKFTDDTNLEITIDFMGARQTEKIKIAVTKNVLTTTDSKGMTEKFKRVK